MTKGLVRYYGNKDFHFITCSCYGRRKFSDSDQAKHVFEEELERARQQFCTFIRGYVVMPEHFHLLVSEPDIAADLSQFMQVLKQKSAKRILPLLRLKGAMLEHFWQKRFYDFNVYTAAKDREKLRYMHYNPVKRGLVEYPHQWKWSSFLHHQTGIGGTVEIESIWTANKRDRIAAGIPKTER